MTQDANGYIDNQGHIHMYPHYSNHSRRDWVEAPWIHTSENRNEGKTMSKNNLQPKDFASLRGITARLSEVVEGLAGKPEETMPAARKLLADLNQLLPKKSLAELSDEDFETTVGLLAEIDGHENLGLILGPGAFAGQVEMLWTGNLVVHTHHRSAVFPRYDLQSPIPMAGIPTRTTCIELARPIFTYEESAPKAVEKPESKESSAKPTPNPLVKPRTAAKPKPVAKPAPKPQAKPKPTPVEEELQPITFDVFSQLPNRSIVTTDVKATGGKLDAIRTRKGRWRLSDMEDSCSDSEAWQEFIDAAEGNPIHLVVGSHEQ